MSEKPFTITAYCGNCGQEWPVQVEWKTKVDSGYQGLWLHPASCHATNGASCKGGYVECPNCGRKDEVQRKYTPKPQAGRDGS